MEILKKHFFTKRNYFTEYFAQRKYSIQKPPLFLMSMPIFFLSRSEKESYQKMDFLVVLREELFHHEHFDNLCETNA